ncbi:separin protein [Collariella sp. IMI 366227]|nr:separin protein [Collariella sp. IMI 366227]
MDTPLAQADAVRSAVSSVATCSPATTALLKSLLLPKDDSSTVDEPNSRAASRTANTTRTRANTATRAPSRRAKQTPSPTENGLSIREKAALATHVVNATLKALGEAAKPVAVPATPARRPASDEDLVKTATKNAIRRSSSVPMSPLQPRSLNRQATSPVTTKHARSPSKPTNNTNLLSTVECARVALAVLRQLPASGKVSLPELQLESGMSALVGRLISLNLQEQAIKELRILKKKLEGPTETKKTAKPTTAEAKTAAQVFSELLDFGSVKASGSRLLLVVATQIQILRVLAMTKRPSAIEAVISHLRQDQATSPVNLLLTAAKESGADVGKIARQMETLAQCLLSLTPSVASKDDSLGQEARLSISPATAFEFQALAFEARLSWWKLAKHKGDAEKDILVPLSRCLGTYIRRTSESPKSSYAVCANIFSRIQKQLQSQGLQPSKGSKHPHAAICQTLATLARDAQEFPDAVSWATKLCDLVDSKTESIAKTCSLAAQLLSLHLKQPAKYISDDKLLQEVVAGIQGPLRGDTAELDELLTNICAARKATMHFLLAISKGGDNVLQPPPSTKDLLETFVLQCPRFCLRWLGKPPGPKGSTKDYLRYDQRRQLMIQYLQHILDSAFMTIKTSLDQSRLSWDLMDSILSDCTTLLEYTGNLATSEASSSYYVKISHFYYMQYSSLRQQSTDAKDPAPLRALRRSVDCVKHRTGAEKEKAQLTLKLERLADLARTLGRVEEALGALQTIRTSSLEDGVLAAITRKLSSDSPAVIWTRDEKAEGFSRTLLAISKMEQVWLDWTVDLPEEERAAALEHRLRFIVPREGSRETGATLEHPVVDALLRMYIPTRYPVRRLRVLLVLLSSALGNMDSAPELLAVAKDAAQVGEKGDLGEDAGLVGFLPHMKAMYGSLAAAVEAYSDSKALDGSITDWRAIIAKCQDRAALEKAVDDVPGLLDHLQSIADFLRMKGRDTMLATVLELITDISRVAEGPSAEEIVQHNSCLALQYTTLGQSTKAEEAFLKAQGHITDQLRGEALANFHLAFSEHFLALSNFRQAEEHLSQAQLAFNNAPSSSSQKHTRAKRRRLVATACYLYSLIALERGDSHHALVYSRDSVRTLFQDWAKLESRLTAATSKPPFPPTDQSQLSDTTTIDISSIELQTSPQHLTPGPHFWTLFTHLYRNVLRLSTLYSHLGMFQETMYYGEQALKMARTVGSEFYHAECAAWIGAVSWRAANAEKSAEMLGLAKGLLLVLNGGSSYATARLACRVGEMFLERGWGWGWGLLALAEGVVSGLAASMADVEEAEIAVVELKMARLSLAQKPVRGGRRAVVKAPAKRATKATAKTKAVATVVQKVVTEEDAQLAKLRASILVQKAVSMLRQKDWAAAQAALTEATIVSKASGLLPARQVAMASCLLGMSMEQMAQDPVFSVIQDSTISFPALSGADKGSPIRPSPSPKKVRAAPASQREATKDATPRVYVDNLREAHDYLLEAHSVAALSGDASLLHRISGMLQNVGLFLTATSTKVKAPIHSAQTSYSVELARNLTWRRERKALLQEKNATKPDGMQWPSGLHSASTRRSSLGFTLDLHKVQRDYIDIVPQSWNVISISLSEGNHDLCITKLQAHQDPFVIRLPLERASSRDADSDVFDFQQGRTELLDIIRAINKTCHDSRDMTVKGAKSAWWAEREALDQRLSDLLTNIEQIWLGGFRGIFSQHVRRPELLARFQGDFLSILDKHLPSRRQVRGKKTKAAAQAPRASLDLNVLELFIGLGDTTMSNCDFDEELTDLLYFVVDILQFHGERNAYDEIDFDSMAVQTMDALHAYHSAATHEPTLPSNIHTILLLDKALHVFPWESLPCMSTLAVSRVPPSPASAASSSTATNLLTTAHPATMPPHNRHLHPQPSADLSSTQSTFLPALLPPPKLHTHQTEFSTALTTSQILLYFGHSGAQYIRGRTIRHLDRCRATVLLMGCSSAALSENGEFEPAGPVWNYMMAGVLLWSGRCGM